MKKFFLILFSCLFVVFCFPSVSFVSSASSNFYIEYKVSGSSLKFHQINTTSVDSDVLGILQYDASVGKMEADLYSRKPFKVTRHLIWPDEKTITDEAKFKSPYYHSMISWFDGSSSDNFDLISARGFKYVGGYMSKSELDSYIADNIESPSPVSDSLDSSLGSFVLAHRENAWTNTIYGERDFKGKLRTAVQGTTTTGKTVGTDFDSFQYFTGVGNCHSSGIFSKNYGSFVESTIHQAKLDTPTRGGYSMVFNAPDDFKDPLIQFHDAASSSAIDSAQRFFNDIVKGGNSLSFKPIVYVRPYDSSSGRYGNWLRIVAGDVNSSSLSNGGSSGSGESQTGDSSVDPSSTAFNNPSGAETNSGVTSTGSTEENALNNALTIQNNISVNPDINVNVNNNISNELRDISNASSSSGGQATGSVLSNIVGLLGMIGAVPQMIGVLFSWLPVWCLVVVGVGFALFIPIIIFKLLKG